MKKIISTFVLCLFCSSLIAASPKVEVAVRLGILLSKDEPRSAVEDLFKEYEPPLLPEVTPKEELPLPEEESKESPLPEEESKEEPISEEQLEKIDDTFDKFLPQSKKEAYPNAIYVFTDPTFHKKSREIDLMFKKALASLREQGWRIEYTIDGRLRTNPHIVVCDRISPSAPAQFIGEILGGNWTIPCAVQFKDGKIIRSWAEDCERPLDSWTFGWLATGIDKRPVDIDPKPRMGGYPRRSGNWSVNGSWRPSKSYVISHLLNHGNHRGKFDKTWLQSLSLGELRGLHDDDHERRVRWSYVIRPGQAIPKAKPPVVVKPKTIPKSSSSCPSGTCPSGTCPLQRRRW